MILDTRFSGNRLEEYRKGSLELRFERIGRNIWGKKDEPAGEELDFGTTFEESLNSLSNRHQGVRQRI